MGNRYWADAKKKKPYSEIDNVGKRTTWHIMQTQSTHINIIFETTSETFHAITAEMLTATLDELRR